jgi:hypothetical protein
MTKSKVDQRCYQISHLNLLQPCVKIFKRRLQIQ